MMRQTDPMDRLLMEILIDKFAGGPVGLNTLAVAIGEEADTISDVFEPYLIQIGFLKRTTRGRVATPTNTSAANPPKNCRIYTMICLRAGMNKRRRVPFVVKSLQFGH